MRNSLLLSTLVLAAIVSLASDRTARACPFCAAVSQTFTEEINTMDAAVIGKLVEATRPPRGSDEESTATSKARFEIVQILKGNELLKGRKHIETIYFGEGQQGREFLIMGVEPPELMWSTPLPISPRVRQYLTDIMELPAEGPDRLKFFLSYLEHEEEMLARDAYDEFARTPYDVVKKVKPEMDREQLITWIKNPDIPASRRRLYLTLLGVCGTPEDAALLEQMLKSDDRKMKSGLDALIACYLTLRGADGMPLVEELYLQNKSAEYADTYAAIMALRFHGTEGDVIPKERILQGFYHILERPELADLVIPDLARWEDWSQVERLVQLFKEADEKSSWVRVPVVNYLRACPLPKADAYIKELEKIDPESVKRAQTFFPFGPAPAATSGDKTSQAAPAGSSRGAATAVARGSVQLASASRSAPSLEEPSPVLAGQIPANRWTVGLVPWVLGVALLVLTWQILGGSARSPFAR